MIEVNREGVPSAMKAGKGSRAEQKNSRQWTFSVFWKHMVLMACILAMAVAVLLAYSNIANENVKENYIRELQSTLERDYREFSSQLYMNYVIPQTMEDTVYYKYIRDAKGDETKYHPLLLYIGVSLSNQYLLQRGSLESLLYFGNIDSAVTQTRRVFVEASDCFDGYMHFSDMSSDEIMTMLKEYNALHLLPMQPVSIAGGKKENVMPLIIRPEDCCFSIMTLYPEDNILERLGYSRLPAGSYLRIEGENGILYEKAPEDFRNTEYADGTWLETRNAMFGTTIRLWVPNTYFSDLVREAWQMSWTMLAIMAVAGVVLCVLLSNISSRPIRRLAGAHQDAALPVGGGDEIGFLQRLIETSKEERLRLRDRLTSSLLTRAFSGAVLSEPDENHLLRNVQALSGSYRVAIVHTSQQDNALIRPLLLNRLPDTFQCEIVNDTQTGILLAGDEQQKELLLLAMQTLQEELRKENVPFTCGVSGTTEGITNFSVVVRQAYSAMPQTGGIGSFTGNTFAAAGSHVQYERLHQSILQNDREKSLEQMDFILRDVCRDSAAREMFYSIRLIIRQAAEETNIPLQELNQIEYEVSLLPRENVLRLRQLLETLFDRIRDKRAGAQQNKMEALVDWIGENYHDESLCVATAAARFDMTERQVYETVRKVTGMNYNSWLLKLRMENAAKLLRGTNYGIRDICSMCGYSAESTFYRVFKKYYGVTTTEFRKDPPPEDAGLGNDREKITTDS